MTARQWLTVAVHLLVSAALAVLLALSLTSVARADDPDPPDPPASAASGALATEATVQRLVGLSELGSVIALCGLGFFGYWVGSRDA